VTVEGGNAIAVYTLTGSPFFVSGPVNVANVIAGNGATGSMFRGGRKREEER